MKKKCPLCNKLIEVERPQTESISETKCPKCNGELIVFNNSLFRIEGKKQLRAKCPSCGEKFLHEISRDLSERYQIITRYHQKCPMCETPIMIREFLNNNGIDSHVNINIDTFAAFPSAHYVIAAKAPFDRAPKERFPTVPAAEYILKNLLELPDEVVLAKKRRYKDYKTVSEAIRSYIVRKPKDAAKLLPKGFAIVYSSGNLLAVNEKNRDFLNLLETLISFTKSVKDVCGKAAIIDSTINDLRTIPSEIPEKWSQALQGCQSTPGYNMFDPFYEAPVFMDFENLAGFQAERHIYKPLNEAKAVSEFKEDIWYRDYGCIHPSKIIDYATKNIVAPDAVVNALGKSGIPVFELDKDAIDWHDYEDQFDALKLKEDALNFPSGRSIRQALGNTSPAWKNTRKAVLERQKYTCQICGYHTKEAKFLHAHEVWEAKPEQGFLRLMDIQLLCNHCHDCKHIGQLQMRNPTNPEPYDRMIMHMAKVNNCSPEVVYAYHEYRIEQIHTQRQEKEQEWLIQHRKGKNVSRVYADQPVRYIIDDNVPNRSELVEALDKKGLIYCSK